MRIKLSEKMGKVSTNVNLIRFLSAIAVIMCHSYYVAGNRPDPVYEFSRGQINLGGIAVGVFFFYSGFYVTKSLNKAENGGQYIINRCKRIFPQLWIVVLLCAFVLGPVCTTLGIGEYFTDGSTFRYLLNGLLLPIHNLPGVFTDNIYDATVNGPLWTLPVEFVAYVALLLIWEIWRYVFRKKIKLEVLHVLTSVVSFAAFLIVNYVLQHSMLIQVIRPLVIFFIGAVYYDYAQRIVLDIRIAGLFVCILAACGMIGGFSVFFILLFPYIVITVSLGLDQIPCNWKLLQISYEMYLVGWPIQQILVMCHGGRMHIWQNILETILIDIVVAYLLYIFIESIQKKGKKKHESKE